MKKDIFFQLSQNAAERLAERFGTPLLVLSLEQIEKNYRFLKKHLPRVQLYYAIKANPHQRILELLRDLGYCFGVASDGEIRTLAAMGIDGERLIYANPIKTGGGLQACCDVGVHKMTFDSESEIVKMAQVLGLCFHIAALSRLIIGAEKASAYYSHLLYHTSR